MKLQEYNAHEVNDESLDMIIKLAIEMLETKDEYTGIFGNRMVYVRREPSGDIQVAVATMTHHNTIITPESDKVIYHDDSPQDDCTFCVDGPTKE